MEYMSNAARKDLGLEFMIHNLRHTHATVLAELGTPANLTMQRMGHKNISTTLQFYTHVTDKMQSELITKLNALE